MKEAVRRWLENNATEDLQNIIRLLEKDPLLVMLANPRHYEGYVRPKPDAEHKKHTIAATAGNVQTNLQPDPNMRWEILRGIVTLTNGAGVANRYLRFQMNHGATPDVIEHMCGTPAVTASQVARLAIGHIVYGNTGISIGYTDYYAGLGRQLFMWEDNILNIHVNGGLAADSYAGFFEYLEEEI